MLQITADVFSGRSQPSWIVDDAEATAIARELADLTSPEEAAEASATGGLGFRGFFVESLSDEIGGDVATSYLSLAPPESSGRRLELAERLIASIEGAAAPQTAPADALPLEAPLQQFLREQLEQLPGAEDTLTAPDQRQAQLTDDEVAAAITCTIELGTFNPGFWNNDATVRTRNNCYNYASNWRTDTFAQPGRGSGAMYTAITCAEVSRGAMSDGMHRRFQCFPDSEKPRYLVALVVAPGPGFVDFHWFRKQKGGFWGHKPGGTAARNTDNSGVLITNPETANRGPYTSFCGYFYGCDSQRRRIR